jgi:hypothetical protein
VKTQYDNGTAQWYHGQPVEWESYDHSLSRWLLGPCPICGSVTSSYGGGYSCHNDYCPHSANNFVCNAGTMPEWWNKGINVKPDGDLWCATGPVFINLQESSAGFGNTPREAVADYFTRLAKEDQ